MAKRVLLALVAIALACHASANPTDSTQVGRKGRRARTSGHELRNPLLNAARTSATATASRTSTSAFTATR